MLFSCFYRSSFVAGVVLALVLALASTAHAGLALFTAIAPGVDVSPGPGELPESGSITIRLSGDAALPADRGIGVFVDNRDMSEQTRRNGNELTLVLPEGLSGGLHRVRLVIPTPGAQPREVDWSFQALAPAQGDLQDAGVKVASNARRTLYEGDSLEITVEAPPGGRGTASVGDGIVIALTEKTPGQYVGFHDIRRADYASAPVRARMTLPDGRTVGNRSENDVKVFGQMFTVRVDSPPNGSKVPYDFVIKGRTRPHARVSISPRFGATVSPAMQTAAAGSRSSTIQSVSANMGGWDVQADEHGRFEQKFGFPIRLFDISYTFVLTASDRNGEQAIPGTYYVTLTGKKPKTPADTPTAPGGK